jgi:regulatory protein
MTKKYSIQEAKQKIERYCAYQERSHQEVRNKLYEFKLDTNQVDLLIVDLITEGFLNEERYAKAFTGGKFRMKKWGKIKITNALEGKGVSPNCIKAGLKEIPDEDYQSTILDFLHRKIQEVGGENIYTKRDKISKAAILKGYESDLVWNFLKTLLPDQR